MLSLVLSTARASNCTCWSSRVFSTPVLRLIERRNNTKATADAAMT